MKVLFKTWFWLTMLGITTIVFAPFLAVLWFFTQIVRLYEPIAFWIIRHVKDN